MSKLSPYSCYIMIIEKTANGGRNDEIQHIVGDNIFMV